MIGNIFKYSFLLSIILILPRAASAQVAKIIFVTEAQSIPRSTLSEPITIQTVDSDGNEYKTTETVDLVFESTSASGEFLNSSGNPASDYMSRNTAKRTFYYKDSVSGSFTLMVVATGRESGKEWSVSQDIAVGDSASASSQTSSNSSSSSSGSLGSSFKASTNESLEVSAGTDRTVVVGSPINFQASVKKNSTGNGAKLSWSLGDGNVASGLKVTHIYLYPGNYAVALNAKAGDSSVTHRIKVKVIEPEVSLAVGEGYIEISNDMQSDFELFNWKLVSGGRAFIFQPETVILAGSKIKIPYSLLLMKGQENETLLKNPLGQVVARYEPSPVQLLTVASVVYKPAAPETKAQPAVLDSSTEEGTSSPVIYVAPTSRGLVARTLGFLANLFK